MKLSELKNIIKGEVKNIQEQRFSNVAFGAGADRQRAKVRGAEYWAQHPAELANRLGIDIDDVPEHMAFWQAELEASGCSVDLTKTGAPEPTPRRR
jgi:hypothetical protein